MIVNQSGVVAPGTADGAAEQSVVVIQSGVLAQDAADGAAEQSVVVANPEQSVIVIQSGVLVRGAGHDVDPVEEQIFDGVPCYSGRHRVRKEGGKEQGGDIYTQP